MNKIAKLTILTATLVGSFTSCIEETLPTSIVTTDQAAASDTALEGMVGALATSMVDVFGAFGSTVAMHYDFAYPAVMIANDAMAGEVVSTSSEANAGYNWFSSWSSNLYLGPLYYAPAFHWTCYYTYIKAANDVISTISADAEWESDPTKMAYMAIAKTFRASYYLDMARIYEPLANVGNTDISAVERLTVPYVDENTTESDARNGERLDRDDMFEKIFADLAAAEDIYNTEGVKQPTNGTNPDMAVIYGLYARAYLWLGGFDSTKYETAVTYADQAIALSGAITTGAQWTSPTNGFNSAIDSWMWYLPQSSNSISNLVNYVAWLSPEATWGYGNMVQFGMRSSDYNRLGANDIRKSIVVGASVDYSKYASVTNLEEGDFNGLAPYTNLKFRPLGGNTSDYTAGNPTDVPMMRVEEMYFIKAEATAHTNPTAGLAILAEVMAQRDSAYSTDGVEDAIEEIIFQKRMEFWGEGVVLYDLKRLGLGIQTGYSGTNVISTDRWNFTGVAPWWNVCLPESEGYQNTALLDKNNPDPTSTVENWTEDAE